MERKYRNKKFMATALTASLVATALVPAGVSANETATFKDLKETDFGYKEIMDMTQKGIIDGFLDGTFRPKQSLKREEATKLLMSALELEGDGKLPKFSDVRTDSKWMPYVDAAVDSKIMLGHKNGKYGFGDLLTREQMASVFVRAFDLKPTNEKLVFTDLNSASPAHSKDILTLAQNGITFGYKDGTFKPKAEINRVDFSVFLARALSSETVEEGISLIGNDSVQYNGKTYTYTEDFSGLFHARNSAALKNATIEFKEQNGKIMEISSLNIDSNDEISLDLNNKELKGNLTIEAHETVLSNAKVTGRTSITSPVAGTASMIKSGASVKLVNAQLNLLNLNGIFTSVTADDKTSAMVIAVKDNAVIDWNGTVLSELKLGVNAKDLTFNGAVETLTVEGTMKKQIKGITAITKLNIPNGTLGKDLISNFSEIEKLLAPPAAGGGSAPAPTPAKPDISVIDLTKGSVSYPDEKVFTGNHQIKFGANSTEDQAVFGASVVEKKFVFKGDLEVVGDGYIELANIKVDGTLTLNPGDNGGVKLKNVQAGKIVVQSGAMNTTIFENVDTKYVQVTDTNGGRIVMEGTNGIEKFELDPAESDLIEVPEFKLGGKFTVPIELKTGLKLSADSDLTAEKIVLSPLKADSDISLNGDFTKVADINVEKPSNVTLDAASKISKMDISANATLTGDLSSSSITVSKPITINVGQNSKLGTIDAKAEIGLEGDLEGSKDTLVINAENEVKQTLIDGVKKTIENFKLENIPTSYTAENMQLIQKTDALLFTAKLWGATDEELGNPDSYKQVSSKIKEAFKQADDLKAALKKLPVNSTSVKEDTLRLLMSQVQSSREALEKAEVILSAELEKYIGADLLKRESDAKKRLAEFDALKAEIKSVNADMAALAGSEKADPALYITKAETIFKNVEKLKKSLGANWSDLLLADYPSFMNGYYRANIFVFEEKQAAYIKTNAINEEMYLGYSEIKEARAELEKLVTGRLTAVDSSYLEGLDKALDTYLVNKFNPNLSADWTEKLDLVSTDGIGLNITWTSSNKDVISDTGEITRPKYGEKPVTVVMTATIKRNYEAVTKTYEVLVQPKDRQPGEEEIVEIETLEILPGVPLVVYEWESLVGDYNNSIVRISSTYESIKVNKIGTSFKVTVENDADGLLEIELADGKTYNMPVKALKKVDTLTFINSFSDFEWKNNQLINSYSNQLLGHVITSEPLLTPSENVLNHLSLIRDYSRKNEPFKNLQEVQKVLEKLDVELLPFFALAESITGKNNYNLEKGDSINLYEKLSKGKFASYLFNDQDDIDLNITVRLRNEDELPAGITFENGVLKVAQNYTGEPVALEVWYNLTSGDLVNISMTQNYSVMLDESLWMMDNYPYSVDYLGSSVRYVTSELNVNLYKDEVLRKYEDFSYAKAKLTFLESKKEIEVNTKDMNFYNDTYNYQFQSPIEKMGLTGDQKVVLSYELFDEKDKLLATLNQEFILPDLKEITESNFENEKNNLTNANIKKYLIDSWNVNANKIISIINEFDKIPAAEKTLKKLHEIQKVEVAKIDSLEIIPEVPFTFANEIESFTGKRGQVINVSTNDKGIQIIKSNENPNSPNDFSVKVDENATGNIEVEFSDGEKFTVPIKSTSRKNELELVNSLLLNERSNNYFNDLYKRQVWENLFEKTKELTISKDLFNYIGSFGYYLNNKHFNSLEEFQGEINRLEKELLPLFALSNDLRDYKEVIVRKGESFDLYEILKEGNFKKYLNEEESIKLEVIPTSNENLPSGVTLKDGILKVDENYTGKPVHLNFEYRIKLKDGIESSFWRPISLIKQVNPNGIYQLPNLSTIDYLNDVTIESEGSGKAFLIDANDFKYENLKDDSYLSTNALRSFDFVEGNNLVDVAGLEEGNYYLVVSKGEEVYIRLLNILTQESLKAGETKLQENTEISFTHATANTLKDIEIDLNQLGTIATREITEGDISIELKAADYTTNSVNKYILTKDDFTVEGNRIILHGEDLKLQELSKDLVHPIQEYTIVINPNKEFMWDIESDNGPLALRINYKILTENGQLHADSLYKQVSLVNNHQN